MLNGGTGGVARAEWRRGWPTVLACAAGAAASVTHLGSIGVLLPAIQADTGWPLSQITAGLLIPSTISLVASGFVGAAVDRFGSREIGLAGLAAYCASFALVATTGPSILNWWLLWTLLGFGFSCITTTVWAPAIAGSFHASRGLAIAVMLSGNGIAIAALPLVATLFLESYGWRGAFIGTAAVVALVSMLLVFLCLPGGGHLPGPAQGADGGPAARGMSVAEAVRSLVYFRIAISAVTFTVGTIGLITHFVPILRETGIEARDAAFAASGIGLSMIVGRLLTGFLLDRVRGAYVAAISFGLPVVSCLLLFTGPDLPLTVLASVLIGLAMGSELDVVAYMSTRYFGLPRISAIYGTLVGLITFAAGAGPLVFGVLYDLFGSYHGLILVMIPLFLLGSLLMGSLPRYPDWGEAPPGGGTAGADPGLRLAASQK